MPVTEPYSNAEGKECPWTLPMLYGRFPGIAWQEPMTATNMQTGEHGLACRICVARYGLQGFQIKNLPQTKEAFAEHMKEHLKE